MPPQNDLHRVPLTSDWPSLAHQAAVTSASHRRSNEGTGIVAVNVDFHAEINNSESSSDNSRNGLNSNLNGRF